MKTFYVVYSCLLSFEQKAVHFLHHLVDWEGCTSRVTRAVTLVTMGGLGLATNVGSYDALLSFFS